MDPRPADPATTAPTPAAPAPAAPAPAEPAAPAALAGDTGPGNAAPGPAATGHARIEVPPDPRDLPGTFPRRFVVDVRFGDTDAMGHANNSRFLTYVESARIAYWEAATGEPFAMVTHGAEESIILAEVRVAFRSPAVFGEVLTVESRASRVGRTSFTMQHRLTASASDRGAARLVATAEDVLVLYDYTSARPRVFPDEIVARFERFEGRRLRD